MGLLGGDDVANNATLYAVLHIALWRYLSLAEIRRMT